MSRWIDKNQLKYIRLFYSNNQNEKWNQKDKIEIRGVRIIIIERWESKSKDESYITNEKKKKTNISFSQEYSTIKRTISYILL